MDYENKNFKERADRLLGKGTYQAFKGFKKHKAKSEALKKKTETVAEKRKLGRCKLCESGGHSDMSKKHVYY